MERRLVRFFKKKQPESPSITFAMAADDEFAGRVLVSKHCPITAVDLSAAYAQVMATAQSHDRKMRVFVNAMSRSGGLFLVDLFDGEYLANVNPSGDGVRRAVSVLGGLLAARYLELQEIEPGSTLFDRVEEIDPLGRSFLEWRAAHLAELESEGGRKTEPLYMMPAVAVALWQPETKIIPPDAPGLLSLFKEEPPILGLTDWGTLYELEGAFMVALASDFAPRLSYLLAQ